MGLNQMYTFPHAFHAVCTLLYELHDARMVLWLLGMISLCRAVCEITCQLYCEFNLHGLII